MRAARTFVSLLALATAQAAAAQVAPTDSRIDPDVGPDRGLGTTVSRSGNVHLIDGGRVAGTNLFHSFAHFDLASGHLAAWTRGAGDGASITNVINRVTGGDPSRIFGTLDSTALPNADFYFVNPAGIVFGQSAQVNVPAAAHFSTASRIDFTSGPAFQVAAPDGSTLSVANPVAFGFVGSEAAILLTDLAPDFASGGGDMSFSAGDIGVFDSRFDTGSIALTAVGSVEARVGLDGSSAPGLTGFMNIENSEIGTNPDLGGSGAISLAAGVLQMNNSDFGAVAGEFAPGGSLRARAERFSLTLSGLRTVSITDQAAGDLTIRGGDILFTDGSQISSRTAGAGAAGEIAVNADFIGLDQNSFIASDTSGSGNAGSVAITASDMRLSNGSSIGSLVSEGAEGDAGSVFLESGSLLLEGGSFIDSETFGIGDAGLVLIAASEVTLLTGASISSLSNVGASGNAGGVGIDAGTVLIGADSRVTSSTFGSGNAGAAVVIADNLLVTNGGSIVTEAGAGATGNAGFVSIDSGTTVIERGGFISSSTAGPGDAGSVSIGGDIRLSSGGFIVSSTNGTGAGGIVTVSGSALTLEGGAFIASNTSGSASAGSVLINSTDVFVDERASIASQAGEGSTGDAGLVSINSAGSVILATGGFIDSSTLGAGNAGGVMIDAGTIIVSDAAIASQSRENATGAAGTLFLSADNIRLIDGGFLTTATFASGAGGAIRIDAGALEVSSGAEIGSGAFGSGNAGFIDIKVNNLTVDNGEIAGRAALGSTGNAGAVTITAQNILLANDSRVVSSTLGAGQAGSVNVNAADLVVTGGSVISTDALASSTGDAGRVRLVVDAILIDDGGAVTSTTTGAGNAGLVEIVSDSLVVDGGRIVSESGRRGEAFASGTAGNIDVRAGQIFIIGGGRISSDTFTASRAGSLSVTADDITLANGSLSSSTFAGGDAGKVDLNAGTIFVGRGGEIASRSSEAATGNAGLVTIKADSTLVTDRGLVTSATRGSGDAGTILISGGQLQVLGEGSVRSSTSGSGNAGEVNVQVNSLAVGTDGEIGSEAEFGSSGNAGVVRVQAAAVDLFDGGRINSQSRGPGAAGTVRLDVGTLDMDNGFIISTTRSSGIGGGVFISADTIQAGNFSLIVSDTFGSGDGGDVVIQTGQLSVSGGTVISSDTFGTGFGGRVLVEADRVDLSTGASISALSNFCLSAFCQDGGNAGQVGIVTDTLTMTGASEISSATFTSGDAGGILIEATTVSLSGQGTRISSDSAACVDGSCVASGNAGSVLIEANKIEVANQASISSSTFGEGDAGFLYMTGGDIVLRDGGRLTSRAESGSTGNAGLIGVEMKSLTMSSGSAINSSTAGAGDAGLIFIQVDSAKLDDSRILTEALPGSSGDAGVIGIAAGTLTLDNRSLIASDAFAGSTGVSGAIGIETKSLEIRGGSAISTSSANPNPAGGIAITADRLVLTGILSDIRSVNVAAASGDAGQISITSGDVLVSEGGRIATNSRAGAAGNIVLNLEPESFLILSGRQAPGVLTTSSGPGTGGRIVISRPFAIIGNGSQILALGESGGANVQIDTKYFIASADRENLVAVDGILEFSNAIYDVSAGTVNPDLSVLDASGVLRGQCPAVRSTGQLSQLTIRPVGPYGVSAAPITRSDGETAPLGARMGECL